jgi:predicted ATPase/glycosyltransferase involved in cell wall biosynthesis
VGAIVFLSTAWGPRHGGINAFNTDLSEAVASLTAGRLRVICVVPAATGDEVGDAAARGVELVPFDGDPAALAEASAPWGKVLWWIGHDVVSGRAAVAAAAASGSSAAVVQHTNYASYGVIKGSTGAKVIARGLAEVDTLLQADVVFGVGPNLTSAARDRVRERGTEARVHELVPGLAAVEPIAMPPATFRPIAFGRLDPITDRLKQSRLAVHGFARLVRQTPRVVGNEPGMTVVGIPEDGTADQAELLRLAEDEAGRVVSVLGHPYTESRTKLFRILRDASACLMLSLREGFGLTGWEAIAGGVPLIVSKTSGLHVFLATLGGPALGCVTTIDVKGSSELPFYREEDVDAVADALHAIAWDQDAAKANAAALKEMVADYTWERTARGFLAGLELPVAPAPAAPRRRDPATLPPSNVPVAADPLIGRRQVLADHRERVRGGCRLLTLLGPAGVGKTRVAQELARSLLTHFDDHVYFVDLSSVSDPDLVIASITQALRIEAQEPLLDALRELFRDQPALVVLDNFEQVRGAGRTVRSLLDAAPGLHVVATSREPMGLVMERQAVVPPLAPADAARLYSDRVAAHGAGAVPDASTLAALCDTLDRLPLGIELAASLADVVPAADLVPMLEKSALDLKTRRQDVDERQRSLRAAIGWSYELLLEAEQRLFRRLAVFEGGWTLRTASAIVDGGGAVDLGFADAMAALLDKHLIRKVSDDRFDMLATLHQYAAEQLAEDADEAAETRRRHATYFVKVAEVVGAEGGAISLAARLQQLEIEQDNLTAAMTALVADRQHAGALPASGSDPREALVGAQLRRGIPEARRAAPPSGCGRAAVAAGQDAHGAGPARDSPRAPRGRCLGVRRSARARRGRGGRTARSGSARQRCARRDGAR